MLTLEQLNRLENRMLIKYGKPSEFNHIHNKISRSKIRAMKKEYGSCFIWTVNPWNENDPVCRKYKKGMVFNFCGSFITSKYDPKLEKLLKNRLESEWTAKGDIEKINEIYYYANKLNATILIWS
jgi:hypothetical protein